MRQPCCRPGSSAPNFRPAAKYGTRDTRREDLHRPGGAAASDTMWAGSPRGQCRPGRGVGLPGGRRAGPPLDAAAGDPRLCCGQMLSRVKRRVAGLVVSQPLAQQEIDVGPRLRRILSRIAVGLPVHPGRREPGRPSSKLQRCGCDRVERAYRVAVGGQRRVRPTWRSHQMSLPHETRVVTRYHLGVRLDELCAVHDVTPPVGVER